MSDDLEPRSCYDCGVEPGTVHEAGCDIARCMWTGQQAIQCSDGLVAEAARALKATGVDENNEIADALLYHYGVDIDHDCGDDTWTGIWPGIVEAREYGFWCYFGPDHGQRGWHQVDADHPWATEDLNKVVSYCRWDRTARKWVLPNPALS